MFLRRRDGQELAALLRLTRDGTVLYEGEIAPGHRVDLPDGVRLEVLWLRKHTAAKSA